MTCHADSSVPEALKFLFDIFNIFFKDMTKGFNTERYDFPLKNTIDTTWNESDVKGQSVTERGLKKKQQTGNIQLTVELHVTFFFP